MFSLQREKYCTLRSLVQKCFILRVRAIQVRQSNGKSFPLKQSYECGVSSESMSLADKDVSQESGTSKRETNPEEITQSNEIS